MARKGNAQVFKFEQRKSPFRFRLLTQAFIAKELNMPQPQVSAAIKKLVAEGAISKISVGGANGYMVGEHVASRGSLVK